MMPPLRTLNARRGPGRKVGPTHFPTARRHGMANVVSKQIGSYKVMFISGYGNKDQNAFIYLNEPNGAYIGYAGIMRSGTALPANVQWPNGVLNVYFPESQLIGLLDTLRYERPVYVQFHPDLKWAALGTDAEPVGEEEGTGR